MEKSDLLQQLTDVFREVLNNDALVLTPEMTAAEIPGWNSDSDSNIAAAAEARFGIKFKTAEPEQLTNIAEFVALVERKLKQQGTSGGAAYASSVELFEPSSADGIEREIRSFLVDNFLLGQTERLTNDQPLLDNVIESSGVLELVSYLEDRFTIVVADKEINPDNFNSVTNIVAYVTRKLQSKV